MSDYVNPDMQQNLFEDDAPFPLDFQDMDPAFYLGTAESSAYSQLDSYDSNLIPQFGATFKDPNLQPTQAIENTNIQTESFSFDPFPPFEDFNEGVDLQLGPFIQEPNPEFPDFEPELNSIDGATMQRPGCPLSDSDWSEHMCSDQRTAAPPGTCSKANHPGARMIQPYTERCMQSIHEHTAHNIPNLETPSMSAYHTFENDNVAHSGLEENTRFEYTVVGNAFTADSSAQASAAGDFLQECQWSPSPPSSQTKQVSFICDFKGCKAKPFKHRNELHRHQLKHDPHRELYSCPAVDCNRKGTKGFARLDKLKDHMFAGHDDDTLFECPNNGKPNGCTLSAPLTRNLMVTHCLRSSHEGFDIPVQRQLAVLRDHRECPMPKCPFRVSHFRIWKDSFPEHLIVKHGKDGRAAYSERIAKRGYDPLSGRIICPVCPDKPQFTERKALYRHIIHIHLNASHLLDFKFPLYSETYEYQWFFSTFRHKLEKMNYIPDEVRHHRCAILSLWPNFVHHPVWDDLK